MPSKTVHSNPGGFGKDFYSNRASLVAQRLKHLPAMQETQVRSLGQEDPLEKGMATQSSILTWRTPWTEEPGGLQRKQSSLSGKESEQGCIPKRLLGRPD